MVDASVVSVNPYDQERQAAVFCISRCLVTGRASDHPDAWRVPAIAFEDRVRQLVLAQLGAETPASSVPGKIKTLEAAIGILASKPTERVLDPVVRVRLEIGQITIKLERNAACAALKLDPQHLPDTVLTFTMAKTLKRRSVETRVIMSGQPPGRLGCAAQAL